MTNDQGHQMAGLGMTEEDRFRDFLVRSRAIELKRAEMNRRRVELDGLVKTQEEDEPGIKAWLKTRPQARLSLVITTEEGLELEIGAAVEVTESDKVNVYQGGARLAKAIGQEIEGKALEGIEAFPPPKRPRGRPKKETAPETVADPESREPHQWTEDEIDGLARTQAEFDAAKAIDTTAKPATEADALAQERARNVERRKAAAATMRAQTGYDPAADDVQAARAQRVAALNTSLAERLTE